MLTPITSAPVAAAQVPVDPPTEIIVCYVGRRATFAVRAVTCCVYPDGRDHRGGQGHWLCLNGNRILREFPDEDVEVPTPEYAEALDWAVAAARAGAEALRMWGTDG